MLVLTAGMIICSGNYIPYDHCAQSHDALHMFSITYLLTGWAFGCDGPQFLK